jgi:nucleotide-binding universal stress UspA family protein
MYTSILVPLDGSEHAAKALPHAAGLAEAGEVLTLLSVIHPINELVGVRQQDLMSGSEETEDMLAQDAYDDERGRAERTLAAAKQSLAGDDFDVQVRLAEGDPVEQILAAAREADAALIVMTAYGLSASSTPPKTGIFGKVVDGVLKGSRSPVLVVKPWV